MTDAQREVDSGRLYELRKKAHGTNRHTSEKSGKFCHPRKTDEQIAHDLGISPKTVRRAAAETKKIDALGLTTAVMSGEIKSIPKPALDELEEAVEQVPRLRLIPA